jgi:hypothetical protein
MDSFLGPLNHRGVPQIFGSDRHCSACLVEVASHRVGSDIGAEFSQIVDIAFIAPVNVINRLRLSSGATSTCR